MLVVVVFVSHLKCLERIHFLNLQASQLLFNVYYLFDIRNLLITSDSRETAKQVDFLFKWNSIGP